VWSVIFLIRISDEKLDFFGANTVQGRFLVGRGRFSISGLGGCEPSLSGEPCSPVPFSPSRAE
jgi:hypothetical protein